MMAPDCLPWNEDARSALFICTHPDGGTFEEIGRCLGVPAAEVQEIARQAIGKLRRTLGAPARADIGERSVRPRVADDDVASERSEASLPFMCDVCRLGPWSCACDETDSARALREIEETLSSIEETVEALHALTSLAQAYKYQDERYRGGHATAQMWNLGQRWDIKL